MANNFTAAINAFISKSEEKMEAVTKVTFILTALVEIVNH